MKVHRPTLIGSSQRMLRWCLRIWYLCFFCTHGIASDFAPYLVDRHISPASSSDRRSDLSAAHCCTRSIHLQQLAYILVTRPCRADTNAMSRPGLPNRDRFLITFFSTSCPGSDRCHLFNPQLYSPLSLSPSADVPGSCPSHQTLISRREMWQHCLRASDKTPLSFASCGLKPNNLVFTD
jgi:hypothetical protein